METLAPDCYVNHLVLRTAGDIDQEIGEWLRRGYEWAWVTT